MDMIDEELNRLRTRLDELNSRIIPDFENRTQMLYSQIMPMQKGSDEREKMEHEYTLLSKELRMRSDELISIRQQIENLELEKTLRR
jgi:hypothetical protein